MTAGAAVRAADAFLSAFFRAVNGKCGKSDDEHKNENENDVFHDFTLLRLFLLFAVLSFCGQRGCKAMQSYLP